MKVTISVGGRFHAFYLAQQLLKHNMLSRLITSYPKFEVEKYGIPRDKIKSIVIKEVLERSWRKLPRIMKNNYNPQFLVSNIFDRLASCNIKPADIFVGWSSKSLYTLRKYKSMGTKTVIDRGSSHIAYQTKLLEEEYDKFGLKFTDTHPDIINKEITEYNEADFISIPSLYVKRTFIEKGVPENKLIHVPYGVDLREFRKIQKEDNIFRIIYCGPITIQKGIFYLLKAFKNLNLPSSELLLVGGVSSEMMSILKKYKDCFKWIKHQPQSELYKYYSQGSVFVMPSINDGFGMVQVQAMACGLPIISTTNTGGNDLIENKKEGFVIPIRDSEAIEEKILYLYRNPEICIKMGIAAQTKVQNRFSWDDYGNRMIKEYIHIFNSTNNQTHKA